MEVKKGYKQTEVGIIPEDWKIKTFGDIAEITMGQSPIGTSYNQNEKGIALINGPTEFTVKHPIKIQWTSQPTKLCKEGDILICVRGSSTGRMNISDDVYCIGRGIAAIRAKPQHDNSFLEFQTYNALKIILSLTSGSTFPNIDGKSLKSIKIPLPPTKTEQTAIAAVLSDADALISGLEKLIAKKRNIKQGAMQQLLTGKKRLPGFSGEWEVMELGEIFTFLNTANNSREDLMESGEIGYIHYGDIHTKWSNFLDCSKNYIPYIKKEKVKDIPFLENGDLVVADASEDYEGIGVCVEIKNIGERNVVAGLHTLLLRGNKSIVADGFKGYLREIEGVKDAFIRIATGISVYGISKNNLKNVKVKIPPIKEQTAIAQVLSDMDAEIEALEKKLEKYKMIKQGMMQELLTGKTRLV